MALPFYSEVSNFSLKSDVKKVSFALSCVFITDNLSASIEPLNSLYSIIAKNKQPIEVLIINLDKITYNYEMLFSTFPFIRILFIKEKATIKDLFFLGIKEANSKNILFFNQNFEIINLDLDILNIYLSEVSFGIILPLIYNEKEDILPNIIKMDYKNGLLTTYSMDIIGTTISSLYPKYFCFIINKNSILEDFEFYDYKNIDYFLLELGYQLWKNGFIITQARNFKALSILEEQKKDIDLSDDLEYLIFNLRNIKSQKLTAGRNLYILKSLIKRFFQLDFAYISEINKNKKVVKKHSPIEDSTILSIINKDIP